MVRYVFHVHDHNRRTVDRFGGQPGSCSIARITVDLMSTATKESTPPARFHRYLETFQLMVSHNNIVINKGKS